MKRGEVYWADPVPGSGSEQTGRRPVVIVSHDAFNLISAWMSIIVVPVSTSALQSRRGPTVVQFPVGAAGLPKPGVAVCHQVTTLDHKKPTKRIGALAAELLKEVDQEVKAAMGSGSHTGH